MEMREGPLQEIMFLEVENPSHSQPSQPSKFQKICFFEELTL